MHDKCMAVKTITIDLEAYEVLARQKRPGQSFSQVIKERLGRGKTGRELLAALQTVQLSKGTLEAIESQTRKRRHNQARPVKL